VVVVDILIFVVASGVLMMLPTIVILILFGDNLRLAIIGMFRQHKVDDDIDPLLPLVEEDSAVRLPIERIAADLRRLARARRLAAPGSVRHHAVNTVYDRRLAQACASLEIEHALDISDGFDHEIERLRVESELSQAGMVLNTAETELDV
jgi:hypothetical protein